MVLRLQARTGAETALVRAESGLLPPTVYRAILWVGLTVRELAAQGRYPHQSWFRQWSKEDERAVEKL